VPETFPTGPEPDPPGATVCCVTVSSTTPISGIPASKSTKTSEMRNRCWCCDLGGSDRGGDDDGVQARGKYEGRQLHHRLKL